jgi:hypothetical protein
MVRHDDSSVPGVKLPWFNADHPAVRVHSDAALREDPADDLHHPGRMAGQYRRGIGENVNPRGCRWAAAREPVVQGESELNAARTAPDDHDAWRAPGARRLIKDLIPDPEQF